MRGLRTNTSAMVLITGVAVAFSLLAVALVNGPRRVQAQTQCTPITSQGTATMNINVPADTTYRVWSRMNAPDSTNNSFYLKIDSNCPVLVNDLATFPPNTWSWVDFKDGNSSNKISYSLSSGSHTVTVMGKETGVKLDKVLLLGNSCTPTSLSGSECIDATLPVASITSPASNSVVSGTIPIRANASDDASGIARVDFYLDSSNTPFAQDTSAPYEVNWDSRGVADGLHTIRAVATDGAGNISTAATVAVNVRNADITAPNAPTNFTATATSPTNVNLSWTASTDNTGGSGLKGYNLYRNTVKIPTLITGTTYQDGSVAANTGYIYEVEAVDNAGNVSQRVGVGVTTPQPPDVTAPSAPTNLAGIARSSSQIDLSWTKSPQTDVAVYYIRRGGVVVAQVTAAISTYSDTGLNAGTSYRYEVIAADTSNNNSLPSNSVSVDTPPIQPAVDTTPPSVPQNVQASAVSETQVSVSWGVSIDNPGGTGLRGYKVYRNNTEIANLVNPPTVPGDNTRVSFGDTTVASKTTYSYTVRAYDAATQPNVSAASAPASVTTPEFGSDVLFQDSFTGGASQWTTIGGQWSVANDALNPMYTQRGAGEAHAASGQATWANYAVEARVRPVAVLEGDNSAYAGLLARGQDLGHWYYAVMTAGGNLELKINNGGVRSTLASKPYQVNMGTWYKLKFEVIGSDLKVYVNDSLQLTATNSILANGSTSLVTSNMSADFDDVIVKTKTLSVPTTLRLNPTDDAYVESGKSASNFGSASRLLVDNSPNRDILMKFNVSSTAGRTITSAKLRLYNVSKSPVGGYVFRLGNNNWSESTLTWANAPVSDTNRLASFGSVSSGRYYEVDITKAVIGDGIYGFRLKSDNRDGADYVSKESSSNKPELVITVL